MGRQGHERGQPRLALRQRAGLVDDERVDLLEDLERLGVLDEDARRRAAARAHHDRHRRREAERARARDDQHRHRLDQRVGEPRLGPQRSPRDGAHERGRHDGRHEVGGHAVGQALDRGAAPLGLADQLDDLREQRVPADALGPHHEAAGAVDGAARDPVARPLLDRHRLAGDHRLVDGAPSLEDDAVDRDPLAGPHAEPIADRDLIERHVLLAPVVAKDSRRLRREPQQRPDRAARPAPRAQLQHLAQQHEHRDDGRRLEVEPDVSPVAPHGGGKRPGASAAATL